MIKMAIKFWRGMSQKNLKDPLHVRCRRRVGAM
jgi:hypothetical protein